ncbi:hypothetical protein Ahy_B10g105708 [Arachis hypogaea]|uniref:Uncharacterized protein n=1 Tax=Arachis hypogaea TaxID=3818 RepID=A0A444X8M8_ARAHY|nr:hypothetical protein Ahy_B10g105708 [Arachis hypogaea]
MQRKVALTLRDAKSSNANKMKALCGKEALVKLSRWHFGYSSFKGKQLHAIQAVLSGNCICSVQCKQIKEEEVDEQILSSFTHTRVYHGVKNHVTQIRLESLNFKESTRK